MNSKTTERFWKYYEKWVVGWGQPPYCFNKPLHLKLAN